LRLFSFGGYGLALAALALVVFGAYDSYPYEISSFSQTGPLICNGKTTYMKSELFSKGYFNFTDGLKPFSSYSCVTLNSESNVAETVTLPEGKSIPRTKARS